MESDESGRNMERHTVQIGGRDIHITIVRKKMKTVRLKVHLDGKVVLSAPYTVSDRWIKNYIDGKADWIHKHLCRIEAGGHAWPPIVKTGVSIRILGEKYLMQVSPSSKNTITKTNAILYIESVNPEDQDAMHRQLDRWWRAQAIAQYQASLHRLYPIVQCHGVKMPHLSVRRMKTLWGSCSIHRGAITVNYYLYKAPLICIDYIILHELAHFLYRYHDKDFYGFIARYMPDWKERKRALNSETTT